MRPFLPFLPTHPALNPCAVSRLHVCAFHGMEEASVRSSIRSTNKSTTCKAVCVVPPRFRGGGIATKMSQLSLRMHSDSWQQAEGRRLQRSDYHKDSHSRSLRRANELRRRSPFPGSRCCPCEKEKSRAESIGTASRPGFGCLRSWRTLRKQLWPWSCMF